MGALEDVLGRIRAGLLDFNFIWQQGRCKMQRINIATNKTDPASEMPMIAPALKNIHETVHVLHFRKLNYKISLNPFTISHDERVIQKRQNLLRMHGCRIRMVNGNWTLRNC